MDRLEPGDRVLLRRGDTFAGSLTLRREGAPDRPITIASYPRAGEPLAPRPVLAPPPGRDAICVEDAGGIVLRDLELRGPGIAAAQAGNGIALVARQRRGAGIAIRDVLARDFRRRGVHLLSLTPGLGFDDVTLDRVDATGNGEGGFGSWGPCAPGQWSFRRIRVRDSRFFLNPGIPEKTDKHSGNGLVLGDAQDSVVERCAAWGNGQWCNSPVGGPVGLWLCESDACVIRDSVSCHNRTGAGSLDGGGFDLDGGCTRCVIENCLSYGNDGAGYLVCQYPGARPLKDCVVRNCLSLHDGRAHQFGALAVWTNRAADLAGTVVAHCTFINAPPLHERAAASPQLVHLLTPSTDNQLLNSVLVTMGGAGAARDLALGGWTFAGNRWHSAQGPLRLMRGQDPVSLEALPAGPVADVLADPGFALPAHPLPLRLSATVLDALRPALDGRPLAPLPDHALTTLQAVASDPAMPAHAGAPVLPAYGPAGGW